MKEMIERLRSAIEFERQRATKAPAESAPVLLAMEGAVAELSRLTVSPLPGEIEWRVARLQTHAEYLDRQKMGQVGTFIRESAAALERLARENERLKTQLHDSHVSHAKSLSELGNRTIRLGEFEAERDALQHNYNRLVEDTSE